MGVVRGQSYETLKAPFVNARITTTDLKDRHFAIVMKAYKALVEASHRQVLHSKCLLRIKSLECLVVLSNMGLGSHYVGCNRFGWMDRSNSPVATDEERELFVLNQRNLRETVEQVMEKTGLGNEDLKVWSEGSIYVLQSHHAVPDRKGSGVDKWWCDQYPEIWNGFAFFNNVLSQNDITWMRDNYKAVVWKVSRWTFTGGKRHGDEDWWDKRYFKRLFRFIPIESLHRARDAGWWDIEPPTRRSELQESYMIKMYIQYRLDHGPPPESWITSQSS